MYLKSALIHSCSTNLGQFFHIGTWYLDNLIFVSVFKAGSHYAALASLELRDMSGCVSQVCVPSTMAQNKLSPIPFEMGVVLWVHTSVFISKRLYLFRKTRRANNKGRWSWHRLTPSQPCHSWHSSLLGCEMRLPLRIVITLLYHNINILSFPKPFSNNIAIALPLYQHKITLDLSFI